MVPRPPSSEFSSKQQVVVNAITCWLVNNEKQHRQHSFSLSLSLSLAGHEEILHKFKRSSSSPMFQGNARLCMRPDIRYVGASPLANKTKNSGTILSVIKRSRECAFVRFSGTVFHVHDRKLSRYCC